MNRFRLLASSLRFYVRGNIAVLFGAAVSAAVLAGALLVGDSLRGSLRDRTERQLNGTQYVLTAGRFFRSALADELPGGVKPVILLQGAVRTPAARVGKVNILGVDARFAPPDQLPEGDTVVLSHALAEALHAKAGDTVTVTMRKGGTLPQSSALAKRGASATTQTSAFTVGRILPQDAQAGEFTLSPNPSTPYNLIASIQSLQRETGKSDLANVLLSPAQSLQPLESDLQAHLTLRDWDLKVRVPSKRQAYIAIESDRMLLEPAAIEAAQATAKETNCRLSPLFVYLTNRLQGTGVDLPYSVVAGIDPADASPLNPLAGQSLADDEIILVQWEDAKSTDLPWGIKPGESVTLTYFKPEVEGRIEEATHTLKLKTIVPLKGALEDPDLVPEFPGITSKLSIKDWDPPFPYDNTRVKPRDERYWNRYQATPKAYVTLKTARKLWGGRFGDTTAIRLLPNSGDLKTALPLVKASLLKNLDPQKGGFVFDDVRKRTLDASSGSTDFGMLFVAFSFFLIAAALMLVGLLFRLNMERRAKEFGLLRATGFPLSIVRRQMLWEGLVLSSAGSAIGLVAAAGFAALMLKVMISLWPTAGVGTFLKLHISPTSLAIGFVGSVLMSELAILWAIRGLSKIAPAQLLKGSTTSDVAPSRFPMMWVGMACVGFLGAAGLALMAPSLPAGEPRAGAFFGCGSMVLIALMSLVALWLRTPRHQTVHGVSGLSVRNASRNPTRSLLTAGLLASAAFLIVAVESFRRTPDQDFLKSDGGSGGFPLLAESDSPLFMDFNTKESAGEDNPAMNQVTIINEIIGNLQQKAQADGKTAKEREAIIDRATHLLQETTFHPFAVRAGDDASCLNLYQATRPRVLGVPDSIIDAKGFRFSDTDAKTEAEKANPWLILRREGDAIPGFVEENTAIWQLKKGIGDILEIPDETGKPVKIVLAGFLKDSVFQSEVLIAGSAFRKAFPRTEGAAYFLINAPSTEVDAVSAILADGLAPYGFEPVKSSDRLGMYLAVQNTYLSTFQLLGGFGLLLGGLGLAVVLLRNVFERRGELSLLRAFGYRAGTLDRLVFVENSLLLVMGLGAGVLAALAAVAPHLAGGGEIPWARLALVLTGVLVTGLLAAAIAVRYSLRISVVQGLRKE
ncbi:ABC transporter permease [Zavarzinella formosa]|uniref:ABC transporter permease n=1 Tax=Zavarzinella formosa TaxID=360055 RepID=UPI0002F56E4A|nr:ABC transporter permease [Zavarzinella formosa]